MHVVDRRVVAPCVARPSARDGLAEASLSRATSEPSAARSSKSFAARRGAAGRTAKSWPSTLACRAAVGGAGQSGKAPAKPRARLDTRSAVGDQLAALVDTPRRAPLGVLPLEEVEGAPGQRQ